MGTIEEPISDIAVAAVEREAVRGLSAKQKSLPSWLFYDESGSLLFERITSLPEYYLTRKERQILTSCAEDVVRDAADNHSLAIIELGAGTAAKTGLLLEAAAKYQDEVLYQPIDVSPQALRMAENHLRSSVPGILIDSLVANYTEGDFPILRPRGGRVLVVYLGSSIGNFTPAEAKRLLRRVRHRLCPGDHLLIGMDLIKSEEKLIAAYDDEAGVTASFNLNVLTRLNRELGANFDTGNFTHEARWNRRQSRVEMHLVSRSKQYIEFPTQNGCGVFASDILIGESIHTENSYKFTEQSIESLLTVSGFAIRSMWQDPERMFCVTLAVVE